MVGVEPLVTLLTLLYIVDIIYMWNINMEYHTVHLLLPKFDQNYRQIETIIARIDLLKFKTGSFIILAQNTLNFQIVNFAKLV